MGAQVHEFNKGDMVRLVIDERSEGIVMDVLPAVGGMPRYRVFHGAGNVGEYYADQLAPLVQTAASAVPDMGAFIAGYAARKLSLPSYSSMFSLNAGKIKFIPYQFRPLKKIVKADRPRLLIADEVGVGKTIETGIIIKEFEQREDIESVLIVCPKELAPKWQREMRNRFDEPFTILDGPSLDYCIRETELEGEWPYQHAKCIAGLEMIRREETEARLAGIDGGLHFDMLVLDEAHHVVNTASNSFAVLETLAACSDIAVFLSATPIQLKSRDLFALLSLLLPEDFTDEKLFNEMAAPNKFLNGAMRNVRASSAEGWQERAADELSQVVGASSWAASRYSGNRQLEYWEERLHGDALDDSERMSCLRDLEELHSFAHVINRTKRRDIGEFTLREPVTVEIEYSEPERVFHEAAHEFELAVFTALHGGQVANMIMATIDRLVTSCLPAFVNVLDRFIGRALFSLSELSDDIDSDSGEFEVTQDLSARAAELKCLASKLPEKDAKTEQLLKIIDETMRESEDGKLLVFSFFKHTLRYLEGEVAGSGVRCALLTGDTPSEQRDEMRERFRLPKSDPNAIDVLLSSEVGCEGLDYEFCSRMVNYDIPWNPMKIEQRIGRIDRFGQKSPKVRIYNFVTKDTVEERIFFRCYERLGVFSSTVGDLEGVLGNLESDLTKIAFDLELTDEQKAEKAQQGIDNAIRDAVEQREFETNSKNLFLMDVASEDKDVEGERSAQMGLLQRLLAELFTVLCPNAKCELVNPGQVRLRLFKGDKEILRKRLIALKRARKVEPASDQCRMLEDFLADERQIVMLDFDGSKDPRDEGSLFISLSSPLVVMALEELAPAVGVQELSFKTPAGCLEAGTYSYACFEWEEKGYRSSTDIEVVVCEERSGEEVELSLIEFEELLLSGEAIASDAGESIAIDELVYERQTREKKRLSEVNEDTVKRKLALVDESFRAKIKFAQKQIDATKNAKIKLMREKQIQNQHAMWDARREELQARSKADILVRKFAFGKIEVV